MRALAMMAMALIVWACGASNPSRELVEARAAYEEASEGQARDLVPDKLLEARQSLDSAESAFDDDGNSQKARTLAYIAHRKARIAMAAAGMAAAQKILESAEVEYKDLLEDVAKRSRDKLGKTENRLEKTKAELERQERELANKQKQLAEKQTELTEEQKKLQAREAELAKERAAREEAEKRLADALKSLEEVAKVNEDARGTIITLSGAVLFKTGESGLLPIAERQLAKVADALNAYDEGRTILVAGHTDSRGSSSANKRLSLARAESVRTFLVNNGVASGRIRAAGRGEDEPIADNRTSEGRANNRRVEIIVEGQNK